MWILRFLKSHAANTTSLHETTWKQQRCLPGLRCVGNPPNGPANSKGTCQRVKEGSRCVLSAECPIGTHCTSRWRCEKDFYITGAPCHSNFWCPADHACVILKGATKGNCQTAYKTGFRRFTAVGRARSCNTEIDCPLETKNWQLNSRCINKACLSPTLAQRCETNELVWSLPSEENVEMGATTAFNANGGLPRHVS